MKGILIDPVRRDVWCSDLASSSWPFGLYHLGVKPTGVLPNGDLIWLAPDPASLQAFSIGGGPIAAGIGFVVGRLNRTTGGYRSPQTDPDVVRGLTRFSELHPFEIETTPRAVTPEILAFCISLDAEEPILVDVCPLPGALPGKGWSNVDRALKLSGGDRILGWSISERPGLYLTAEFHACGQSASGEILDPTPKVGGERRILFAPAPAYADAFDALTRPASRRLRLFNAPREAPAPTDYARSAGRNENADLEAGRSQSPDDRLAKGSRHPLEAAIDAYLATCDGIERLTILRFDGTHTNHPDVLAESKVERRRLRELIVDLARKEKSLSDPAPPDLHDRGSSRRSP